jgi:hypothetical protein
MSNLEEDKGSIESAALKSTDSKVDVGTGETDFFKELGERQRTAKAYQENTDGRPTGPATDNFGRVEISDGDEVLVKGADQTSKVMKEGQAADRDIAGNQDRDWVDKLRNGERVAPVDERAAECVQLVDKDKSQVGTLIKQDFDKWLKVVTDKDSEELGLVGKTPLQLREMFEAELDTKPNTNARKLATIMHELKKQ